MTLGGALFFVFVGRVVVVVRLFTLESGGGGGRSKVAWYLAQSVPSTGR